MAKKKAKTPARIARGEGTITDYDKKGAIWDVDGIDDETRRQQQVMVSLTDAQHDLNRQNPEYEVGSVVEYCGPELLPDEVMAFHAYKNSTPPADCSRSARKKKAPKKKPVKRKAAKKRSVRKKTPKKKASRKKKT